jgi:hypothetical protein
MIMFGLGLNFKVAIFSVQFYPLRRKSVLNEQLSLNSMWTSTGTDLAKTSYTKAVDDFDAFSAGIYTPLYGKRSRSNDLWKPGGTAGISNFLD